MRFVFIFFVSLLLTSSGWAQERIRNVQIWVIDSSKLEIHYDLVNVRPGDSVYLDVRSRLRGMLRILPEFVRGDIGMRLTAGTDRRIVWDALANGYSLNEEIQAIVRVKTGLLPATPDVAVTQPPVAPPPAVPVVAAEPKPAVTPQETPVVPPTTTNQPILPEPAVRTDSGAPYKHRYAGPAWALLSAVAPGVGNIFVQWPKPKIGFRPIITIGCYGLIAYGILERQKSRDDFALYEQQKNTTAAEPYYTTANDHYHRYYLATRGAIVVAAVDVVLTFIKGLHNSQLQKEARRIQSFSVRPGLQAGQPTAVLSYSF